MTHLDDNLSCPWNDLETFANPATRGMGCTCPVTPAKPTANPTAKQSRMRRFVLNRSDDKTGTSGTGIVAEGVQFSSGDVALTWLSNLRSVAFYSNIASVDTLHGHFGATTIEWVDP